MKVGYLNKVATSFRASFPASLECSCMLRTCGGTIESFFNTRVLPQQDMPKAQHAVTWHAHFMKKGDVGGKLKHCRCQSPTVTEVPDGEY